MIAVAFEVQHRIDHVFQHFGPRNGALFGHMAHNKDHQARLLGNAHELRGNISDLAHRTRCRS
ncbi:hypothetical protein SDC9_173215 [bioreactor metagenome]|uniref:Uncharacterized protein n=1 Tax=bioreactor metagenome TaxID=1076179 RepID=A0A645GJ07_9ZZZZ